MNDVANGFARMIRSDGFNSIGWWKDGFLHGYGKQVFNETITEGLFEKGLPKDSSHV